MSKRGWSAGVIFKYALFQIPSYLLLGLLLLVARHFMDIPTWVILSIIAFWFTKDVFLFPSVWKAYDMSTQGKTQPIIGMQGTVEKELNPSGSVKVRGELWQAELTGEGRVAARGEKIEVQGIRGLTLLVKISKNSKNKFKR